MWAQAPSMASTARATPARRRPVTAPPGCDATPAPLLPTMKAPEAATRWSVTDSDVATGFPVVVDATGPLVVTAVADETVVDGSGAAPPPPVDADAGETGGADVEDDAAPRPSDACEPPAQAVPPRATMSNRTRVFTGAHDRAVAQVPLSTSAMSSPI